MFIVEETIQITITHYRLETLPEWFERVRESRFQTLGNKKSNASIPEACAAKIKRFAIETLMGNEDEEHDPY